ncbi:MAG: auracyanin family protein [Opitutaceae bacterium]|jgi:azurin|nr:auracyanin family protein [Opitutaceae bacterium]
MKNIFSISLLSSAILAASAWAQNPSAEERFAKPSDELVKLESQYWERTPIPIPDDIILESSGILALPNQELLVTTRRGEIWHIAGAYDKVPNPKFTLFASGLHEPLGIIAAPQGGFYVAQRPEVTHIEDTDGDGRADSFKTIAEIPISGSYHEYAFGPIMAPNGNMRVTLNVAFGAATQSPVPWRGWMIEITPDGQVIPIAAGLRSPAGFTVSKDGVWLSAENQGEWVGSGRVTQIDEGDFIGHIASLAWTREPGSTVTLRPGDIPDSGEPMHEVAKRIPGIKSPAVWLPHTIQGISTAGLVEDLTGGDFGPFAGQYYISDQGQSKIIRMSMEQVKGVWQGASYAFREGFECGIIRLTWGENATLWAGETNRGWGSVGPKREGLERLTWTGKTPFEIKEATAQVDGFLLTFTQPVDQESAADPANYGITSFTYKYHKTYGSPPINVKPHTIAKIEVADDGLSVRIAVPGFRQGYVHEIKASGLIDAKSGEALLHDTAYYTLNEIPYGERIAPPGWMEAETITRHHHVPAVAVTAASVKNQTAPPAAWNGKEPDQHISIGTKPGLQFDQTLIEVKAGSRIQFTFNNVDDMMHNFVLTQPGKGMDVGNAAMQLGVAGEGMNFVPKSDDVIAHTKILHPESSETIYFTVPDKPGDYDYVCTFPGHAFLMKGILRVTK